MNAARFTYGRSYTATSFMRVRSGRPGSASFQSVRVSTESLGCAVTIFSTWSITDTHSPSRRPLISMNSTWRPLCVMKRTRSINVSAENWGQHMPAAEFSQCAGIMTTHVGSKKNKPSQNGWATKILPVQMIALAYILLSCCRASDLFRLWSLRPLRDLELYIVSFFQAAIAFGFDRAVVHKNIRSIFASDETKPFCVIEPLYFAFQ